MRLRTIETPDSWRLPLLLVTFAAGFGLSLAFAASASAEDSWGYDLAHELMSPYCPGRTLATCPSPQAAELVQWIVMQEAAGVSRDQVVEMLIARFGEDILGAPPAKGITLWAYIFPVLAFLVGGGAAFLVLRRIVGAGAAPRAQAARAASTLPAAPLLDGPPKRDVDDDFEDSDLARIVDGDLDLRA
jgi:cytochrome c-type biogenesis protein CcmH/NrfF